MSYQPGLPRLSPEEVQFLNAPGNEVLRGEWLDWLALLHGHLALFSPSAPRPPVPGEDWLDAEMERRIARLQNTLLHDRVVLGRIAVEFVRRVAGEYGPGDYLNEVVDSLLAEISEQYNLIRSHAWMPGWGKRSLETRTVRGRRMGGGM